MKWVKIKVRFEGEMLVPANANIDEAVQDYLERAEMDDWLDPIGYEVLQEV